MRSQALFRRSKSLFTPSSSAFRRLHPVLASASLPSRSPRKDQPPPRLARVSRKRLSTTSASPSDPPEDNSTPNDSSDPIVEKPKLRRAKTPVTAGKDDESLQFPDELDILWTPSLEQTTLHASALPPDENFEDALNNLLISLHPQTQHRAAYKTPLGGPTEPTIALYCPIEGGDYIIDATVRELALQTGAEVLVLDAVQLAAGEWGQFGAGDYIPISFFNPTHTLDY